MSNNDEEVDEEVEDFVTVWADQIDLDLPDDLNERRRHLDALTGALMSRETPDQPPPQPLTVTISRAAASKIWRPVMHDLGYTSIGAFYRAINKSIAHHCAERRFDGDSTGHDRR